MPVCTAVSQPRAASAHRLRAHRLCALREHPRVRGELRPDRVVAEHGVLVRRGMRAIVFAIPGPERAAATRKAGGLEHLAVERFACNERKVQQRMPVLLEDERLHKSIASGERPEASASLLKALAQHEAGKHTLSSLSASVKCAVSHDDTNCVG